MNMSKVLVMRPVTIAPDLPPLQAVQLPDGEVGATLRSLCAALSLNIFSQQKRIARSRHLRVGLTKVTVATRGGPQEAAVLLAWVIPLWAIGIQSKRLDAAKRACVLIVQTQAVQALYRAFRDAAAAVETVIEAEPVLEDGLEARLAVKEALRDEVAGLKARLAAIEETLRDLAGMKPRMAVVEATLREQGEQIARLFRRLAVKEALLAAVIERLLGLEQRPAPRGRQWQRGPGRPRRVRRRRGGAG
jgi:hypothetical protein